MNGPMKETWRFLKFVLFSVAVFISAKTSSWPYWPSYLIALVLSVLWNFTLNRKFTFRSAANVPKAMLQVFGYYCVFTPATLLLGAYLTDGHLLEWQLPGQGWNEYLVTAINMLLNLSTEFLFQRYVVYRNQIDTAL